MAEKIEYWMVFAVSIAFSLGWFFYCAVISRDATDAGRGGAIGTAVALFFLFVTRDHRKELFRSLAILSDIKGRLDRWQGSPATATAQENLPSVSDLNAKLSAAISAMELENKGHKVENLFLASATFIGTIVTGFGDFGANFIMNHLPH